MIHKYRYDKSDSMFSTGHKTNKRLKSKFKASGKTHNPHLTKAQVDFYNKIDKKE